MSSYTRGRGFEYRVKYHLMALGYDTQRSPASRGCWDIRAERGDELLFIQCKGNKIGYIAPAEWNALLYYAHARGGLPLVAYKTPKGHICFKCMTAPKPCRPQPWEDWPNE